MKTTVGFTSLPGVVFSAPVPKVSGASMPYSQMRVGSDDTMFLAAPSKVEVEVEHDEDMPHHEVRILALRILLRATVEATYDEFVVARQYVIASLQSEASL